MAKKFKIKDSDPRFRDFRRQITKGLNAVNIGIFGANVINEIDDNGNEVDVVLIAASNEFGTERIPERSFLRSTVDNRRERFRSFLSRHKAEMMKSPQRRKMVLERLGILAESEVIRKINQGPFTPNAPSTIQRKGSSKPLIDTGRMRQSITSKVVRI